MKDVLNLNTELLRRNRFLMLTEVISQINSTCKKGKNWDKRTLELFLKKYSEKHIIIWYLQKKLRTLG